MNTHGTPVAVIDYVAAHGLCMTESMLYKRGQSYVRWRLDKHLMALALTTVATPRDKCDFRLTTSITGVRAHSGTATGTSGAVENLPGHLSLMHAHCRQGELVVTDITEEALWHRDGERWKRYLSVFDDAAFRCAEARIEGEGGQRTRARRLNSDRSTALANLGTLSVNVYANVSKLLSTVSVGK